MDDKFTQKRKKSLKLVFLTFLIIFIAIFLFWHGLPSKDARSKITQYLYDKYGTKAISKISFSSQGFSKAPLDFFNTRGYVYKYYSNEFPNRVFYVTLWKRIKTGEEYISEVNGNENPGMDDNCSSSYDDESLETAINNKMHYDN